MTRRRIGLEFARLGELDRWLSSAEEIMTANLTDRITVNPSQCGGRPCIRGMRIRVIDVLDLLAAGMSREEILSDYPELEAEDIEACLRFARDRIDHPIVAA
jgi:uncharacterized protein (DUF433 family)